MKKLFSKPFFTILFISFSSTFIQPVFAEPSKGFSDESELGIVLSSGNTRTQSVNAKQSNAYIWSMNQFKFTSRYLSTKDKGSETSRTWALGLRYERELSEIFSLFLGQNVESDIYVGILQRYNSDLGVKYSLYKTDHFKWFLEGGYRYTVENKTDLTQKNSHYGRAYTEAEKAFNKEVSAKYWIEYLPNFTTSNDYQINTEISFIAQISAILVGEIEMIKEFIGFLKTYGVVGLAIAVIIGGKLNEFVTSLVQDLLMPLLFLPALKAANVDDIRKLSYHGILYGKVLGSAIDFVIIALVVFAFAKYVLKEETVVKR